MRDGDATRRRILDAATAEFAAFGIAGARVDRIAAAAKANKAQMYAWYGSKDGLFDAIVDDNVDALVEAIPLDGADLPGYAVRLYDEYLQHPQLVRLTMWRRLERVSAGPLFGRPGSDQSAKVASIVQAQRDGAVDPALDPVDVHELVIGMSMTWSAASITTAASPDEAPAVHDRRRAALAQAVRRAFLVG
jgi:AcrR family transcriptional regulator